MMGTQCYRFNDGGRADAGFKGKAKDCVVRSVAIATGLTYKEVYVALAARNAELTGKRTARDGLQKAVYEQYLRELGFQWVAAPKIDGRKARVYDLPKGAVIARQAHHLVAVIDGVANDVFDCTGKMVYGFWAKQ